MLLTEKEAREKWCPDARVARWETIPATGDPDNFVVGGTNRDALGKTPIPASCRCLASDCVAWRWAPECTVAAPPKDADPETVELIRQGLVLKAIKRHREHTGSTLLEAKYYVQALRYVVAPDTLRRGYCGRAGEVSR